MAPNILNTGLRRWNRTVSSLRPRPSTSLEFPLASHLSIHLLLSSLLLFSFGFLPRTEAFWRSPSQQTSRTSQRISTDRPEHPFLTPITGDVGKTMILELIGVGICMVWYGGHLRGWWLVEKRRSSQGRGQGKEMIEVVKRETLSERLQSAQTAALSTIIATPLFLLLLIILGAPLTQNLLNSTLLSLHLSILTIFPIVDALGVPDLYEKGSWDRFRLTRLFCELDLKRAIERATVYPVIGCLAGAWMGVIPLALDWDRPWQSYPLTPTFGSILGFISGGTLSWVINIVKEIEEENRAASSTTTTRESGLDRAGSGLGQGGKKRKGAERKKVR